MAHEQLTSNGSVSKRNILCLLLTSITTRDHFLVSLYVFRVNFQVLMSYNYSLYNPHWLVPDCFFQEENSAFISKLLSEVEDVILEVEDSKVVTKSMASLLDEVPKTFSALIETFLVSTLETSCNGYSTNYSLSAFSS